MKKYASVINHRIFDRSNNKRYASIVRLIISVDW